MLDFYVQLHACPDVPGCASLSKGKRSGQSPQEENERQQFGLTMRTMDRKTG